MTQNFVLLNGDTVFEPLVLDRLLAAPPAAITLAIDHKAAYDRDDMKVCVEGPRLRRIGKSLPAAEVDGESIGLLRFAGDGPELFRAAVETSLRAGDATQRWYLSVIDELAASQSIAVQSVQGLAWQEIDYPADYARARALTAGWARMAAETG